jgi:mono/diheme cytochrome c family protein
MTANSALFSVSSASLRRYGMAGLLATAMGCGAEPSKPAAEASSSTPPSDALASTPAEAITSSDNVATVAVTGSQLYLQHCGACHGEQGDGLGRAALFLFPKPRDFRGGRFKLVSSANSIPTAEDIEAVLVRGMPGSSMPSWAHLPKEQRSLLVEEVLRMFREGAKDRYVQSLRDDGGMSEEELASEEVQQDIQDTVASMTTPELAEDLPEIDADDEAAVARGKEIYVKQSCHSCHGNEGKGDGVQAMFDETGLPTRPRDLTQGIYKGGHDVPSLFRRIYLGMPGTPMPSSQSLSKDQIVDLSHFLRSLSTEAEREAAVMRRVGLKVARVGKVTDDPLAESWSQDAVTVQLMPLWWRDGDFRVQVQAQHDGDNLAMRLTWPDATQNAAAVRPDEFEDMAAIEWYEGDAEPFLGMGAPSSSLDLWQWRAGREATGAEDQLSDEYPFDTEEYRRLAGGKPLPDFVTARAGGNPLATREHSASNLTAGGHGSLTFRPKASQVVSAKAVWSDGHWSVVFVRPLQVSASDGLTLRSGRRYSGAFAIWDGEARDRAGQKLISMWNDLELE